MDSPPVFQPRRASRQSDARALGGPAAIALVGGIGTVGLVALIIGFGASSTLATTAGGVVLAAAVLLSAGLMVVAPNESKVLVLFGRYAGTVAEPGLWWVNPLTVFGRQTISLRVRNFVTDKRKVNDAGGSPIEIAAVVVWRVVDTARAVFDVEEFREFVRVQSDTGVRYLASQFPYDDFEEGAVSLRGNADEVVRTLHRELQTRLDVAGIEVLETRITHLAYAQEIAQAMLRRQQATAIVAARRTIVAGAVGLVDMALRQLEEQDVVELDGERKAAMVSNLMVVLSGDRGVSPVVNTGSLYS